VGSSNLNDPLVYGRYEQIEVTAKTADEAVAEACRKLGANADDVTFEVLDEGAKGLLGLGGRPVKVLVKKLMPVEEVAADFLNGLLEKMNIPSVVRTELKDKDIHVNIIGKQKCLLIGKRGQTLDAIQYLTNLVVNKGEASYRNIIVDTENYRKRRQEALETLSLNLARKVRQTKRSVTLEPMSPFERKIIHSTLQNDKYVTTRSEGEEPYRNIVISLKRQSRSFTDKDRDKARDDEPDFKTDYETDESFE